MNNQLLIHGVHPSHTLHLLHGPLLVVLQAPVAKRLMEDGIKKGHWVFLANCHLMTSWLPTLDKLVDGLEASKPHNNFRLWLSSNPSPAFPISLLQAGLKMTTEPPKGLRANLLRLYNGISEDSYKACKATGEDPMRHARTPSARAKDPLPTSPRFLALSLQTSRKPRQAGTCR
jgi:hypothetical protein